ncbi:MAG: hypothetical protein RIC03_06715 [Cyclobacteriaceae bacterium]
MDNKKNYETKNCKFLQSLDYAIKNGFEEKVQELLIIQQKDEAQKEFLLEQV